MVRGAIVSVPRGQWEATVALNMTRAQALRRIILPQAFAAMIPPWGNLFIELLKSTTSRRTAIVNHALSMLLFVACLVEFLLAPAFATSTFFLLTVMVLLDVLAGFIVTIVSARRDVDFGSDGA